jgi:hypothetical protein
MCTVVAVISWMGPYLIRADVVADDAAQHIFWMYRFVDPELFPKDLSAAYFSDSSAAPWGYHALYYTLSRALDLQTAAEWVAVVLVALSSWLAWRLGLACGDQNPELRGLCAVATVLGMLSMGLTDIMSPLGLQRSFALPLMLLCLWALVARRYAWVGVAWILAALIYPVVLVVVGLTSGFVFLSDIVRERRLPPAIVWNAVLGMGAVVVVVLNISAPPGLGPTVTGEQARAMVEFYPGGRLPMFGMNLNGTWLNDHHIALGWSLYALLLLAMAALVVIWRKRLRSIPVAGWIVVAVGLGVWLISRQVLFELYLPNRHSRWSLACFAMLVYSAAGYALVEMVHRQLESSGVAGRVSVTWIVAVTAPVLVAIALVPQALRVYHRPVDVDMERAYQFIASLPKDTLVAAHPDIADFVPLRSRRSVLASTETSLPWGLGYYRQVMPRIEASLRAAYATDLEELDAGLSAVGVDVVLTNDSVWGKQHYYQPFDGLVRQLRERGDRLGYVLRSPPTDRVLFHSGGVFVVKVGVAEQLP